MNNKKIAVIVILFVSIFLFLVAIMGVAGHIPFLKKPLVFIIAIVLLAFVTGFFALIAFRRIK
ncbi:MAG: hypothetical protein ACI4V4_03655 [Eubacterium sp.]